MGKSIASNTMAEELEKGVQSVTRSGEPRPSVSGQPPATEAEPPARRVISSRRSRLASQPFAVLLPEVGELKALMRYRAEIEGRLEAMGSVERELTREERLEEAMWRQVLLWLDGELGELP